MPQSCSGWQRVGTTVRPVGMRAVVQRVSSASVSVDGNRVSSIGKGLLVLAGLGVDDSHTDLDFVCRKVLKSRLWPSKEGKGWDQDVKQMGYEVLVISQFTLLAKMKGNKPSYHLAMPPNEAKAMFADFVQLLGNSYEPGKVHEGVFAAMMDVQSVNEGPVTLTFTSKEPQS